MAGWMNAFRIAFYIGFISLAVSHPLQAEESLEPVPAPVALEEEEAAESENQKEAATQDMDDQDSVGHSRYLLMGGYAPVDLLIPSKIGGTAGYIESPYVTYELEYLSASLSVPFIIADLGGFSEARATLLRRKFLGSGSFNVFYGISYFTFELRVGNIILDRIPLDPLPVGELIRTEMIGFSGGLGNRWTWKNVSFGVDWITWSQPFLTTKKNDDLLRYVSNSGDRDNIEKVITYSSYFPRISLFKVQLGASF